MKSASFYKKAVLFTLFCLSVCTAYGDTLYLKNGKTVEGKILEKTDKYIKIDSVGVVLTYWMDEIEKIGTEAIGQPESLGDTGLFFKKGTGYLQEGKWEQAISQFKSAISIDPNHVGAHFNLGCAYALAGEYDQAIKEFEKVISLETPPFNAFCYFNIAGIYLKEAMLKKDSELCKIAANNFEKATHILPSFVLAMDYARQSLINAEQINLLNFIKYSVSEIGIPPDSVLLLPEEKIKGKGQEKVCLFDIDSPPMLYFYKSPSCHYIVCSSKIDYSQGVPDLSDEAQICFKSILNLLDKEPENHLNRLVKHNILILFSNFYKIKGDWDRTIEYARNAQEIGLNYSNEYTNLAIGYFKKGDYLKAKQIANEGLEFCLSSDVCDFLKFVISKTEEANN